MSNLLPYKENYIFFIGFIMNYLVFLIQLTFFIHNFFIFSSFLTNFELVDHKNGKILKNFDFKYFIINSNNYKIHKTTFSIYL